MRSQEDRKLENFYFLERGRKRACPFTKAYFAHKLTGNVKAWYQNLTNEELIILENGTTTGSEYLKRTITAMYNEFLGRDEVNHAEEVKTVEQNNARWYLDNITINDMCYFNNFACEYEKYYYKINTASKGIYNETFFNKLPKPHVDQIKKMWESRPNDVPETLGGRIRNLNLNIDLKETAEKETMLVIYQLDKIKKKLLEVASENPLDKKINISEETANIQPIMDVQQLQYFKKHTLDETKLLIFKILRELPTDVHLPILTIIDLYEE